MKHSTKKPAPARDSRVEAASCRSSSGGTPEPRSKNAARPLTNKQRVFVEEYLTTWNATEAARRAGYSGSDETLAVTGSENLRKPNVSEYIKKRISEKAMSADEVLLRLGEIARGSLKPFTKTRDDDIWPDLTADAAQEKFHLLKKIKPKRRVGGKPGDEWVETEVEIEIHDPLRALELLGRNHKLFTDKHEHGGELKTTPGLTVIINGTEPSSKTGDSIPVDSD
jgi:phage terminase small subunit